MIKIIYAPGACEVTSRMKHPYVYFQDHTNERYVIIPDMANGFEVKAVYDGRLQPVSRKEATVVMYLFFKEFVDMGEQQ
jgi:hypothetical protein